MHTPSRSDQAIKGKLTVSFQFLFLHFLHYTVNEQGISVFFKFPKL